MAGGVEISGGGACEEAEEEALEARCALSLLSLAMSLVLLAWHVVDSGLGCVWWMWGLLLLDARSRFAFAILAAMSAEILKNQQHSTCR